MTMFLRSLLPVACMLLGTVVAAADYPMRPIRMIVPFGIGTTSDIIARQIGAVIAADLGQNVVIDNRPGAAGTLGAAEAARSSNDGQTLVLGTIASHGIGTIMFPNVRYDAVRDFQPITLIANAPNLMVVHRSIPARTPTEFIDYARKHARLNFTSAGTATTSHLAGELLRLRLGAKLVHVPYKAGGQALTDVIAGQVPVMIWQVPALRPHVESGALRAVAAMSAKRIAAYPNVPTIAETVLPEFDSNAWFGVLAPAGTATAIIERLHRIVLKAIDGPELRKQLEAQGLEPAGNAPSEFRALIDADLKKWRDVIRTIGVKAE